MKKKPLYGHVTIYALIDPTDGKIRYVGRSKDAKKRFRQHLAEARNFADDTETVVGKLFGLSMHREPTKDFSNHQKLRWIANILKNGKEPILQILDEWDTCPTEVDANRLEDAWIAQKKMEGCQLFNYIYSERQKPKFYLKVKTGKYAQYFAKSPQEYIERLKSGKIVGGKPVEIIEPKRPSKKSGTISRAKTKSEGEKMTDGKIGGSHINNSAESESESSQNALSEGTSVNSWTPNNSAITKSEGKIKRSKLGALFFVAGEISDTVADMMQAENKERENAPSIQSRQVRKIAKRNAKKTTRKR